MHIGKHCRHEKARTQVKLNWAEWIQGSQNLNHGPDKKKEERGTPWGPELANSSSLRHPEEFLGTWWNQSEYLRTRTGLDFGMTWRDPTHTQFRTM